MKDFLREMKQYATPCNLAIILVNILVFAAGAVLEKINGEDLLSEQGALAWWLVFDEHQYYRLITYMFIHGSISHIFNNMLVLAFVGSAVEKILGRVRYLLTYVCSGVVAGLVSALYNRWCFNRASKLGGYFVYSVGASGAIFGVVGVLLVLALVNRGRIAGISSRQIILFTLLSVYAGVTSTGTDNAAHIGGAVFGIISALILYDRHGGYA